MSLSTQRELITPEIGPNALHALKNAF